MGTKSSSCPISKRVSNMFFIVQTVLIFFSFCSFAMRNERVHKVRQSREGGTRSDVNTFRLGSLRDGAHKINSDRILGCFRLNRGAVLNSIQRYTTPSPQLLNHNKRYKERQENFWRKILTAFALPKSQDSYCPPPCCPPPRPPRVDCCPPALRPICGPPCCIRPPWEVPP